MPRVTIYPGRRRSATSSSSSALSSPTPSRAPAVVDAREALVGKVARRTLLPGQPIPVDGVREPYVVNQGKTAVVVFEAGGLTITASALALQTGGIGDLVQSANVDSGKVIKGTVAADGTVRVAGHERSRLACVAIALLLALLAAPAWASARIKDIVSVQGVRDNQLVGYGLVIGLNGTGDTLRNSPFTEQSLQSMLDRMGINVRNAKARTRNVAAVIVTAELPAFVGKGSRIDVTVSSLGDATSLRGRLAGDDAAEGRRRPDLCRRRRGRSPSRALPRRARRETLTQGVPTAGRIPNGALVEREAPGRFADEKVLVLELRNPDFNTAVSVADAINAYTQQRFGIKVAREHDLRTVVAAAARTISAARFMAEIGELAGPARRAGARRHRRAHRHDRHRPGRADLDGGGDARQPDGARHRDAQGLAAAPVLARARRSSRRDTA